MHPILFKIGSFTFYTHGLLAVTGILAGSYWTYKIAKSKNQNTDYLFDTLVYAVLAGIVGARISYYFIYLNQFSNWKEIFYLWQGGMVSYGGFILGAAAFAAMIRWQKMNVRSWFDTIVPGFFLGLFFGRIGNIMAGEYNGTLIHNQFSFPVVGLEAILCIIIFLISIWLYKINLKKKIGLLTYLSFALYGLGRFGIDFLRQESTLKFGLSLGQYFDALLFIVFAILFVISIRKAQNEI